LLTLLLGCASSHQASSGEDSEKTGLSSEGKDICEIMYERTDCLEEPIGEEEVANKIANCRAEAAETVIHMRSVILDAVAECIAELACEDWGGHDDTCFSTAILQHGDGLIEHNVPDACFRNPELCEDIEVEFKYHGAVEACEDARIGCEESMGNDKCWSLVALDSEQREKATACWSEPVDCDNLGDCLVALGAFGW
jgi:hypothetical protein